jgi:hypothetical protein
MVNRTPLEARLRRYLAERDAARAPIGLEERIMRAVKEQPSRRLAPSWSPTWTWPRQLIAVAVIAALGLGIAAGVIYLRQLSGAAPAGPNGLTPAERTELSALEARPLVPLPSLPPGGACPVTQQTLIQPYRAGSDHTVSAAGSAGVYGSSYNEIHEENGDFYEVKIFTDPTIRGVVLIRARQIGSTMPVLSFGQYAAGRARGSATVAGQHVVFRSEQVLPAAHPPTNPDAAPGWGIWYVWQGLAPGNSGCNLAQIDTAAGTEVIISTPGR